jgi:hypothetical protein
MVCFVMCELDISQFSKKKELDISVEVLLRRRKRFSQGFAGKQ